MKFLRLLKSYHSCCRWESHYQERETTFSLYVFMFSCIVSLPSCIHTNPHFPNKQSVSTYIVLNLHLFPIESPQILQPPMMRLNTSRGTLSLWFLLRRSRCCCRTTCEKLRVKNAPPWSGGGRGGIFHSFISNKLLPRRRVTTTVLVLVWHYGNAIFSRVEIIFLLRRRCLRTLCLWLDPSLYDFSGQCFFLLVNCGGHCWWRV